MATITIRNFDDAQLVRLKRKAWEDGLPLEESLRRLILAGLEGDERQPDAFFVLESSHADLSRDMVRAAGLFRS
jgi:plasmid stability protein